MKTVRSLTLALLAAVQAFPVILDPQARPHALLDSLSTELDGIDVRRSWSSKVSRPTSDRPHLAQLRGYTAGRALPAVTNTWITDFVGANDAVLAVKAEGASSAVASTPTNFQSLWELAPREQRIFLSFTRQDSAAARSVSAALRARGYVVFTYVNDASARPLQTARQLRAYYDGASQRLVLDSPGARKSAGVKIEAAMASAQLAVKPTPPKTDHEGPNPSRSAEYPCCQLCRYRNGVLIGCGPEECGPQCLKATSK